jgi:hypothetical protein
VKVCRDFEVPEKSLSLEARAIHHRNPNSPNPKSQANSQNQLNAVITIFGELH